jgi:flagellar L-ring protein precursor FlgH
MVVVAESSTATHTTTTEREKEVKLSGGPTGGGENLLDFLPSFGANSKTEYKGEGVTVRTGDLIGKIACKIIRVLPNGNLSIKGERKVRVNNDEELMILTGVIRPDDIRPDNTILSYYVSDVNIRFRGGTSITDEERPGLFHRVFSGIWDIIF